MATACSVVMAQDLDVGGLGGRGVDDRRTDTGTTDTPTQRRTRPITSASPRGWSGRVDRRTSRPHGHQLRPHDRRRRLDLCTRRLWSAVVGRVRLYVLVCRSSVECWWFASTRWRCPTCRLTVDSATSPTLGTTSSANTALRVSSLLRPLGVRI